MSETRIDLERTMSRTVYRAYSDTNPGLVSVIRSLVSAGQTPAGVERSVRKSGKESIARHAYYIAFEIVEQNREARMSS